jgi:hypothetical protein
MINLCAAVSQQFLESGIDIEHDLSAAMRAAGKHLVGDVRVIQCLRVLLQQSTTSCCDGAC